VRCHLKAFFLPNKGEEPGEAPRAAILALERSYAAPVKTQITSEAEVFEISEMNEPYRTEPQGQA